MTQTNRTISNAGRLSSTRIRELRASAAFAARLRRRFEQLGFLQAADGDRVAYDLAEVQEICQTISDSLRQVLDKNTTRTTRFDALREIQVELFAHLPYHMKSLNRQLEAFLADIDPKQPAATIRGRRKKSVGGRRRRIPAR